MLLLLIVLILVLGLGGGYYGHSRWGYGGGMGSGVGTVLVVLLIAGHPGQCRASRPAPGIPARHARRFASGVIRSTRLRRRSPRDL